MARSRVFSGALIRFELLTAGEVFTVQSNYSNNDTESECFTRGMLCIHVLFRMCIDDVYEDDVISLLTV